MKEYTIDAENMSFGRVASDAASILRGKKSAAYKPNSVAEVKVKIANLKKIKLTGNKWNEKTYKTYSGYPGGQKIKYIEDMFKKDPEAVFRHTVEKMLPKNRLRKKILNNLIFDNDN